MGLPKRVMLAASNCVTALGLLVGMVAPLGGLVHATGDSVDELHYSYGNDATSVVFDWHGPEQNIYYGLDTSYGNQAVAGNPPIMPTDEPGPFREVALSGLQAGTTYHYKVGVAGLDHTFSTAPTGDYTSVDLGDSMSSACPDPDSSTYMPQMQQLIAAQNPDFVTQGGDIAIANQCGQPAIHAFYTDIEAWSHGAAFQVAFGNHEYGAPTTNPAAPAGTPTDSLANYKGRDRISNAQTVPTDTANQLTHPGCAPAAGTSTNGCMGDDWGYYTAGHVFYITYPEPESTSPQYADWQARADTLMAGAQADPTIDFIVTYGHRPAYTDSGTGPNLDLRSALDTLAAKYSPAAGNLNGLNGKYILNIQHHAHNFEAFAPKNGLTYITDAAGGQGFTNWIATTDPDSVYRLRHFGVLVTKYNAVAHSMQLSYVCGSDYVSIKDTCTYGDTMWSTSFTAPGTVVTPPTTTQWVTNPSLETDLTGWTGVYNGTSKSTRAAGGYDGAYSLRSINNSSAVAANGFVSKPHWIDGTAGKSTVAGTAYTGSLYVKSDVAGQKVSLLLRELTPGGTQVGAKTVTVTAPNNTSWYPISGAYTAVGSGNVLAIYVSAANVAAGKGFNADAITLTSANAVVTPPADTTPPSAPTNVSAVAANETTVNLSWTAATDDTAVAGYNVLRGGVQMGTATGTTYTDTTATAATAYTYTVQAYDAAGNVGAGAVATVSTPSAPVIPPNAPTNLAVTASSPTEIDLSWNAATAGSAPITGYTLVRNGATLATVAGTAYADTGLTPGTAYTYTVIANDANNNASPASNALVVNTPTVPAVRQWVTNQSFETDLTGWTGVYNTNSKTTRVAGGYDGSYSLRSVNTATATAANGIADKPHWIDGTVGKTTTAGTVYTANVWVKADVVGQKITLFMRELNPSGVAQNVAPYNVGVTVTATSTGWFTISEAYPAVGTGNSITIYLYATNSPAGQGFLADAFSLTSPS